MLTKVKDTLPLVKQSSVVYGIPCNCGQVYIGDKDGRDKTEEACPLHVVSTRMLVSENLSFQASTHAGANW